MRSFSSTCMLIIKCSEQESKWTTMLKRQSGEVDFLREWQDYVDGFGSSENYWMGLDSIHALTSTGVSLLIYLETFNSSSEDIQLVFYRSFQVEGPATNYKMSISGYYDSVVGDSMHWANDMMFSTKDKDNDEAGFDCVAVYKCSWWLRDCFSACPTGLYQIGGDMQVYAKGIIWPTWKGYHYSMKRIILLFREL